MPVLTLEDSELPVKQEVREYRVMCQTCRSRVTVGSAFAHSEMDDFNRERAEWWADKHAEEHPNHRLAVYQFIGNQLVYTVCRKGGAQ